MLYEVNTPEEYLDVLDKDWRKEKLLEIRNMIKSVAPEFAEGINYKMLSYSDQRGPVFHLNAQRNYVSLYVGDARKVDPNGELLKGIDVGKGCLRFKKSINPAETRVEEFIKRAVDMWKSGMDIEC